MDVYVYIIISDHTHIYIYVYIYIHTGFARRWYIRGQAHWCYFWKTSGHIISHSSTPLGASTTGGQSKAARRGECLHSTGSLELRKGGIFEKPIEASDVVSKDVSKLSKNIEDGGCKLCNLIVAEQKWESRTNHLWGQVCQWPIPSQTTQLLYLFRLSLFFGAILGYPKLAEWFWDKATCSWNPRSRSRFGCSKSGKNTDNRVPQNPKIIQRCGIIFP